MKLTAAKPLKRNQNKHRNEIKTTSQLTRLANAGKMYKL